MTQATLPAELTEPNRAAKPRGDRRCATRYPCGLGTSRHIIAKVRAAENEPKITAQVRNVSATGLSILVDRALTPEQVLRVELYRPSRFWSGEIPMRVVYSQSYPDGEYIVGGAFTRELNGDELQALLG